MIRRIEELTGEHTPIEGLRSAGASEVVVRRCNYLCDEFTMFRQHRLHVAFDLLTLQ